VHRHCRGDHPISTNAIRTAAANLDAEIARWSIKDPALKQALDEIRTLGVRYLERALELDPNLESAKATL
jgi:hypothetical protein